MNRRALLQGLGIAPAAGLWAALAQAPARAQAIEKPRITIAVGGKNLLYYLPLTIAEQRGYFKGEGLDITIVDFAGGARALQAVVGGSADVVSGAFEHTVNMPCGSNLPRRNPGRGHPMSRDGSRRQRLGGRLLLAASN